MASRILLFVLAFLCCFEIIHCHTWLDCIKVTRKSQFIDYQCAGYGRGYPGRQAGVDIDRLYTYKILDPPASQLNTVPICDPARQSNANTYTNQYPMTTANPGETLTVAYTPNGHKVGPGSGTTSYPTFWSIHWTGEAGTQLTSRADVLDGKNRLGNPSRYDTECSGAAGNSNGSDGQPCYGSFTIPAGTKPGVYSFVWYWAFNKQGAGHIEEYTTCFDVRVAGNSVPPQTTTTSTTGTRAPVTSTTGARADASTTAAPPLPPSSLLIKVTVTVSLPGPPNSVSIEKFVTGIANILKIPIQAILEANVMLDRSTSTKTIITFVVANVAGVDPISAAQKLQTLAQSQDPVIKANNLEGLEVLQTSTVDNSNQSSGASVIGGFSLLIALMLVSSL